MEKINPTVSYIDILADGQAYMDQMGKLYDAAQLQVGTTP